MARVEAALDFADEADVPGDVIAPVRPHLTALSAALTTHLADARRGEILRDGFHVVLAGPPNAGKSSLLNALAQRDVAIVSPRAGTTRDVIEVRLDLGGLPVILSDTAGVRAAQGEIESDIEGEGIRRALARATAADLVLWVTDATAARTPPPPELEPRAADTRWVVNKSDLRCAIRAAACPRANVIHVSALTGAGIGPLVDQIAAEARARLGDATAAPALTRVRHRHELERCRAALDAAILGDPADLELRAEDLRLAATALGRVTGRVDVEDVLDRIFASFCIGK